MKITMVPMMVQVGRVLSDVGVYWRTGLLMTLLLISFFLPIFPASASLMALSSMSSSNLSSTPSSSSSSLTVDGAALFDLHCAGCHPNGNNIIRRRKNLKRRALKRQHLDSVDAIATLVTQGKGLMSAYENTLTPSEIDAISTYVWAQAQTNWK